MSDEPLLLILGGLAALALAIGTALFRAREADRSGELRFRVRGVFGEHVIRRSDDPVRFDLELKILRAVPWFGLTGLALAVLMMGYFA
ncbi:hypothetical protein ABS767_16550 [Sphingomonas sp. ST-64]|uniref:Uncharacterized protein n=1 Tax=Sphingomonas plantiphila TaxID=3163295 RepID=A0ABW8YSM4_9SPHN